MVASNVTDDVIDGTSEQGKVVIDKLDLFIEATLSAISAKQYAQTVHEVRLAGQGTRLRHVPPLAFQLRMLRHLDLSDSLITCLPSTVADLTHLQALNMARCELGSLPPEISHLHSLTQLDVSAQRPGLQALPSQLAGLSSLTLLNAMSNAIRCLPEDIGSLTGLRLLGLKSNRLGSLPPSFTRLTNLVELFITDNQLVAFPEGMGNMVSLVKIQASFNCLRELPVDMCRLPSLEMLRVAVCDIQQLPPNLTQSDAWPRLAWFSLGGNPACAPLPAPRNGLVIPPDDPVYCISDAAAATVADGAAVADVGSLAAEAAPASGGVAAPHAAVLPSSALHEKLGDGASGEVFLSTMGQVGLQGAPETPVAVKIFRADVSPDGRTREEVAVACALDHPRLTCIAAVLMRPRALIMGLVRGAPMAFKPTSKHLLRCRWAEGVHYSLAQILRVAHDVASALKYMHSKGLCHGDVYAHNILVDEEGHATLCDFGASFSYDPSEAYWQAMEVRAYGLFLQDLVDRLQLDPLAGLTAQAAAEAVGTLAVACARQVPSARPTFAALVVELANHM